MSAPAASAETIAANFVATFERIRVERMAGVPILNPALSVAMTALRQWGDYHAGVLVTPWFINAVLVSRQAEAERPVPGTKRSFGLPAGAFEFIRSEEAELGGFWMCSLFSPVFEFADQATALAVAEASLAALMDINAEADEADEDMDRIWRGELPDPRESAPEAAVDGLAVCELEEDDRRRDSDGRTVSRRAFLTAGRGDAA